MTDSTSTAAGNATDVVATTPSNVAPPKKKKKTGLGKYISMLLMIVVVVVVYWEESGLNSLFEEDEGPSELSWKDESKLWNQESVLYNDAGYTCRWVTYKSTSGQSAEICVRPGETDFTSKVAAGGTVNKDTCLFQLRQWDQKHAKQVYLEIGAHIGICMLEMIFQTKATVIAIEAEPTNLFALTSTLMKNPKLLERVTVIPVALGRDTTTTTAMTVEPAGSYGDARVSLDQPGTTPMARLDDLLHPGGIQLISLHANGYECNVIDGGVKAFKKATVVAFSVNPDALISYGCSSDLLIAKAAAVSNGQTPKWYRNTGRLRPIPNKKIGFNAVAKNKW